MSQKIRSLLLVAILVVAFCLQGCSIKPAETTYNVYTDATGKKVTIELKADKSQGYQWKYYTETGALLKSSTDLDRDDILSETRITKCTYKAEEPSTDSITIVLIKDGNIDEAKAFVYPITYNADLKATIGTAVEYTVGLNNDIKTKVQNLK